jgi:lysine 6-dehydrogenase
MIVGAGRQGIACGHFLLNRFEDTSVMFIDNNQQNLDQGGKKLLNHPRAIFINDDSSNITKVGGFNQSDCIISCVPYFLNEDLTKIAIENSKHYCDLGGSIPTVRKQLLLNDNAKENEVFIVPDCGIAPGTANILAEYWRDRMEYKSIRIYCGGIPKPNGTHLNYDLVFSINGLLNEYFDDCQVIRKGKLEKVKGLSEIEPYDFPHKECRKWDLECFHTSGGASLAPEIYEGKLDEYEYKTIRHKNHASFFKTMHEMGFFNHENYEMSSRLVEKYIQRDRIENDCMLLEVHVKGKKKSEGMIIMLDKGKNGFTAMERTTGFSIGICAAYICGLYEEKPKEYGIFSPLQIVPPKLMVDELSKQEINMTISQNV